MALNTPTAFVITSAKVFGVVCLFVCLFVCLSVCKQDYAKATGSIFMKGGPTNNPLHFGAVPTHRAAPQNVVLLSLTLQDVAEV